MTEHNYFTHSCAVVIGIDRYQQIRPLNTAVSDARRLAEFLGSEHGYDDVPLLEDATCATLAQELGERLATRIGEDDRLLLYFAGHGIALDGDDGPEGFLIPADARADDRTTFVAMADLYRWLEALPCRHLLVILDCCFAGSFTWYGRRHMGLMGETLYREHYDRFVSQPAWQILTSAAHDQEALDVLGGRPIGARGEPADNGARHSPFADALFAALQGEADLIPRGSGDGVVTATELYLYLRQAVEMGAEERANHRQTPELWPFSRKRHGKGEFIFLAPGHGEPALLPAPALTADNNPYRGLQSYDEAHALLFFGRRSLVEKLADAVDEHPLTVVLGASGTGKSSVVKAGLLPYLKQRVAQDSRQDAKTQRDEIQVYKTLPPMRPGDAPLHVLAELIAANLPGSPDLPIISQRERFVADAVAGWMAAHPDQRLLLVVDQVEELVTLCRDEKRRTAFLQTLANLIARHSDRLRIIFTLRTDFEPQIQDSPLNRCWKDGRFFVPPMSQAELREVIEGPATVRVLFFEPPQLVDRLIDEVIQTPGALPLLSFSLEQLYLRYIERQTQAQRNGVILERSLIQDDYEALGGVIGSLRRRADEIYNGLPDDAHRATMQRVMLRMVAVDGGELARRRVMLSELVYPSEEENGRVKTVLDRLIEARLLVKGRTDLDGDGIDDPLVEPAHDALVAAWGKLMQWKQEAEEYLPLQRRLWQAASEWYRAKPETRSGLLWDNDPRLPQLEEIIWTTKKRYSGLTSWLHWLKQILWPDIRLPSNTQWLTKTEALFVQASTVRRAKILQRIVGVTLTVIVMLAGLALFANAQRINAVNQANRAKVGELTSRSRTSLTVDPELGVLLAGTALERALASAETDYAFEAADALTEALLASRIERRVVHGVTTEFRGATFSADGRLFAVPSQDGKVLVHNTIDGASIGTFDAGEKTWIQNVAFSPGLPVRLGVAGYRYEKGYRDSASSGFVQIWDVQQRKEVFSIELSESANVINFSPDSSLLLIQDGNDGVQLWDIDAKSEIVSQHVSPQARWPVFSSTGEKLAIRVSEQEIALWDSRLEHELVRWHAAEGEIWGIRFGTEGDLAVTDSQGNVSLWDITDVRLPRLINHQNIHIGGVFDAVYSQNGACVATAGYSDQTAAILFDRDTEPLTLLGHKDKVVALAFLDINPAPDHPLLPCGTTRLATISGDGTLLIWNIGPTHEYESLLAHPKSIEEIEFSSDQRHLITGSSDGTAQLWSVEPFHQLGVLDHGHRIEDVDFSPDGQMIVTASNDGTVKVWQTSSLTLQLPPLKGHHGTVAASFRPPDGRQIATGGHDRRVILWDSQTGNAITGGEWRLSSAVLSIEFSNDGTQMIIGSNDGTSRIISLVSGDVITLAMAASDPVYHAALSPDRSYAFTASSPDGAIRRWEIIADQDLYQRDIDSYFIGKHQVDVYSIDLDSTGTLLASAGGDGKVFLWDTTTGRRIRTFSGSNTSVNSVRFSPNGQLLATGDENGIVHFYHVRIGETVKLAALRTTRNFTENECRQYDIQTECQ
jgi:WD40 repeat protein